MRRKWEPRIGVIRKPGKRVWYFRWTDRAGRRPEEASEVPISKPKREAQRAALMREQQLASEGGIGPVTFTAACERYEAQKLEALSVGTQENWRAAKNHLINILAPRFASDLTEGAIDELAVRLRKNKAQPTTIAGHLRYIKAFLRWCVRKKLLGVCPTIDMPAGVASKKRSRDITEEEFERILNAVPKVRKRDPAAWARFLRGLRLASGLRIEELVSLRWDTGPNTIDTSGQFPGFQIDKQKNGQSQWVAMTPEFFNEFVRPVPAARRRGHIFKLPGRIGEQMTAHRATQVIIDIGRKSGVKTGTHGDGTPKYATSHDIGRRSFATAVKGKLSQWQMAELMRHASPATTAAFYVGDGAREIAEILWAGHETGDQSGDLSPQQT